MFTCGITCARSNVGMTKIKMSKEETSSTEFVEHRRAALERYAVQLHVYYAVLFVVFCCIFFSSP